MKFDRRITLPILILSAGVGVAVLLSMSKTKAARIPKAPDKSKLVRVIKVAAQNKVIQISTHATTVASKELNLSAQISGRVVYVAPQMTDGGWVKKGDVLFTLDAADNGLKVDQANAGLSKAEYDLDNMLAQQQIAKEGLKSYQRVQKNSGSSAKISPLALYGPQIKNAMAALGSAKASLRQAQLNLERTEVKAPFDGYLRLVALAEGQTVAAGQTVAGFFASKPVRLKVSLPLAELPWIKTKRQDKQGAKVVLEKQIGQDLHRWQGFVARRLLEIDSLGHMAQVVVEVENTLSDKGFPLPIGMQVSLKITGQEFKNIISIPLYALRGKDQVWLIDAKDQLEIRNLEILRKEPGVAMIKSGLFAGDRVIVSPLENALPGIKLKVHQTAQAPVKEAN